MTSPTLEVHPDAGWELFTETNTEANYEKIDNWLDKQPAIKRRLESLRLKSSVVAGAWFDGVKTIHCSQTVYDAARDKRVKWGLRLIAHEYGHAVAWPDHDHPTSTWKGYRHADKVGYDVRAFTRFLRWRQGDKVRWMAFLTWWNDAVAERNAA